MKNNNKVKMILRIVGFILIAAGLPAVIIGFIDFTKTIINESGAPKLFFLTFIGIPLLATGIILVFFSYRSEILKYNKQEILPIYQDVYSQVISSKIECECGTLNDADNKFCKKCGKQLLKECPNCHTNIDQDSDFCKNCGFKL